MNLLCKTKLYEKMNIYRNVALKYGAEKNNDEIIVPSLFINIIGKDVNAMTVDRLLENIYEIEKGILKSFIKRSLNEHFTYCYDDRKNGKDNIKSFISALEMGSRLQSEYFGVIHIDMTNVNVFNRDSRNNYELFLDFMEENKQRHWMICFYAANLSQEHQKMMKLITKKHTFIDYQDVEIGSLDVPIGRELFEKYSISMEDTCFTQIGEMLEPYNDEEKIEIACSPSVLQELAYNLVRDAVVEEKNTDYDEMRRYIDNAYIKSSSINNKKTIGFCRIS